MAITVTASDVIAIAPELAGREALINVLIADASLELDASVWGSQARANRAGKYLVAHLATLTARAGSPGVIASESIGSISRSYSNSSGVTGPLGTTSYGVIFASLKRSIGGPAGVT